MIKTTSIPRSKLPFFSKEEIDLIYHQEQLSEFIGLPFAIENIQQQINSKKKLFTNRQRLTLAKVLEDNYATLPENKLACAQIELLKEEKTFTVTTGHQLCLYGGPLYFFIKISAQKEKILCDVLFILLNIKFILFYVVRARIS